ncbi:MULTISPECIES: cell wall hydrolase [unclassified Sphingomonas]|uniref:cell wall hydrolase n=1 Tax=unclassified Sphingomonas TaxID=196159 RepID=UPI00092C976A|nr:MULTISPECIES: cell wall hydrolase [unclassified Sphingomonas]OJU19600.1 MAG: cell wall hydrolase [Sphingomonas sp. 66-10]
MSFFSKAAAAAVATLSIIGLAAQSSAGLAAEVAPIALATIQPAAAPQVQAYIPAPVVTTPNPAPAPAVADETQPGDAIAYPTLAAAVAAQQTRGEIDEDMRCLAGAIYYESKGEPLAGQLAVAEVILNRADSGRFGDTICDVVKQPGQFSFVRGGRVPAVDPSRPAWRTALAVAKVALNDAWESNADDALYFHARRAAPGWGRTRVATIGNHIFYR